MFQLLLLIGKKAELEREDCLADVSPRSPAVEFNLYPVSLA